MMIRIPKWQKGGGINVKVASWNGGISFGGVIAFIFADLIVFPISIENITGRGWPVSYLSLSTRRWQLLHCWSNCYSPPSD